ncbi:hypothetical protein SteCoe_1055 [Stentor coeruleus]|uniref:Uncharacterized protein n=1 Tax=Stentor coeruleus TaxID=5963 RepID=A0A1R2D2M7_9CILI|nr:hypothetical protein SteCoe_1055 [Stentor coeruleus]
MKLNRDFQSPFICRTCTPKALIQQDNQSMTQISPSDYKPRDLEGSNQVLRTSKELSYVHRHLFSTQAKRIRSRNSNYDKSIDANEYFDKNSESDILEPKLKSNNILKTQTCSVDDKERNIKILDYPMTIKSMKRKIKCKKVALWKKQRINSGKNRIESQFPVEVKKFDTVVMSRNCKRVVKKYDFSSMRIQNSIRINNR